MATLTQLLQPMAGLFVQDRYVESEPGSPRFTTRVVPVGDLSQTWPHWSRRFGRGQSGPVIYGAGTGLDEHECEIPALAEALERYCTCTYSKEQFLVASAEDLGTEALDLDLIPRCSDRELRHPRCPLVAPDKKARIRWVRGLSLSDGRLVYIPAVMVYLYTGVEPAERICVQITTGCATHTSFENALVSAILEVIERDALAITWLQRLALPRIEVNPVPESLVPYWERCEHASCEINHIFFNATTDIGIPTIYGVQIAHTNPRLTTIVSCSTAIDPVQALTKVIRDLSACRIALRPNRFIPKHIEDFTELHHGATYMAARERADAFSFLLQSPSRQDLNDIPALNRNGSENSLQAVLRLLRQKGLEVIAIDLTSDEALRGGVRVVRVLIPGLQPFSFVYRAQFLAHPRLYQAPQRMGYPVYHEDQLNKWPQPFV